MMSRITLNLKKQAALEAEESRANTRKTQTSMLFWDEPIRSVDDLGFGFSGYGYNSPGNYNYNSPNCNIPFTPTPILTTPPHLSRAPTHGCLTPAGMRTPHSHRSVRFSTTIAVIGGKLTELRDRQAAGGGFGGPSHGRSALSSAYSSRRNSLEMDIDEVSDTGETGSSAPSRRSRFSEQEQLELWGLA